MVITNELRTHLHQALDVALDTYTRSVDTDPGTELVLVNAVDGGFTYTWPPKDGKIDREDYHSSSLYQIVGDERRIRVGWTSERLAWGKKRERAVAFLEGTRGHGYPLIEFVESDDGEMAAIVPDPKRPRSALSDPTRLPARFDSLTVKRTDDLFDSVQNGPSLRLVCAEDDEFGIASHGLWVGRLRGRL